MDHTPAICTHVALEFQGSSATWPEPAALWKCKLCGPAQAGWQPWQPVTAGQTNARISVQVLPSCLGASLTIIPK